jgi:hypothetical protein
MNRWLGLVLIAACKASSPPARPEACEKAIGHLATMQNVSDSDPLAKYMHDVIVASARAMTTRCSEDAWSAEAVACFAGARSTPAVKQCTEQLTPEQRTAMDKAVGKATASVKQGQ